MRVPSWTGFRYKNKDFLEVAIPQCRRSNCKNVCCWDWTKCIRLEECAFIASYWDPIRKKLSQENINKYSLVTLDCYFTPPNLLNVGLVAKVRGNKVQIWFLTGRIITVDKSLVFKFPKGCRVEQLRPFIILKIKKDNKKRKLRYNLRNKNKKPEIIIIG